MGIIRKTFFTTVLTGAGVFGYLGATTTLVSPLPGSDPVWRSKSYARYNIHRNAAMHDVAWKRIPLNKVKPELLEKEGSLVLEFCRGMWGGLGRTRNSIKDHDGAANIATPIRRLPTAKRLPLPKIQGPCDGKPTLDNRAVSHINIRAGHPAVRPL
jgi:hypothetical protein